MPTHKPELYNSYLVRLWQEENEADTGSTWRSEIESIQTGQKWQFGQIQDLKHFFQSLVEAVDFDFSSQTDKRNHGR